MNDDFNSPKVIANLFNLLKYINSFHNKVLKIGSLKPENFELLRNTFLIFVEEILGLKEEKNNNPNMLDDVLKTLLETYSEAKNRKDYATVDLIRKDKHLQKQGFRKIVNLVFSLPRLTNKRYSKKTLLSLKRSEG